jgi:hypothetical protein
MAADGMTSVADLPRAKAGRKHAADGRSVARALVTFGHALIQAVAVRSIKVHRVPPLEKRDFCDTVLAD